MKSRRYAFLVFAVEIPSKRQTAIRAHLLNKHHPLIQTFNLRLEVIHTQGMYLSHAVTQQKRGMLVCHHHLCRRDIKQQNRRGLMGSLHDLEDARISFKLVITREEVQFHNLNPFRSEETPLVSDRHHILHVKFDTILTSTAYETKSGNF